MSVPSAYTLKQFQDRCQPCNKKLPCWELVAALQFGDASDSRVRSVSLQIRTISGFLSSISVARAYAIATA